MSSPKAVIGDLGPNTKVLASGKKMPDYYLGHDGLWVTLHCVFALVTPLYRVTFVDCLFSLFESVGIPGKRDKNNWTTYGIVGRDNTPDEEGVS